MQNENDYQSADHPVDQPRDEFDELVSPGLRSYSEPLLRWATQLLGFILTIVGLYFTIYVFLVVFEAVRTPEVLQAAVTSMSQLIEAESLVLPTHGESVPVGKSVAVFLLLIWYVVLAHLGLSILSAGVKLVFAAINERKELLAWAVHARQSR